MALANRIINIAHPDKKLQQKISHELGISAILAQLLINRKIHTLDQASKFLDSKLTHLLDPFSFKDMHAAIKLIKNAIAHREKILIFGDYDVDGITSVALLKNTLLKMGANVSHYIPHRIKEGYGLPKNILHLAKEKGARLLITVDCGTTSRQQISELKGAGIDVIITDHHEPLDDVAIGANAIINPKIKDSGYKFRDLAGVGVAYKLCQGLCQDNLLDEFDLVTLGTVADVVPLIGENRIIVKEGLKCFHKTKKDGLRALMETSGIKDKKFCSYFISYILAPRLNASGRMDTAEAALELILSTEYEHALVLAKKIEAFNRQRQKIEAQILNEAQNLIEREINFKEHKIIVVAKESWHQGVLGIVASKLSDRFYRPTVLISMEGDLCKGSARSIKNFHLFDALLGCKELLHNFGGHSHAAGLVINKNNIEEFKKAINALAKDKLRLEDLIPSLDIDMQISFSQVSESLARELEILEPYGPNNPEPLFYTTGLKLKGQPACLARGTLKFWASDGQRTYQVIGFGMSDFKDSIMQAKSFDLVYAPKIDEWRQEESIILEAKDIILN